MREALATPKWVDVAEMVNIYGNTPEGMSVDHIVPLAGVGVSGLHVPWNLRYIDKGRNGAKGNRIDLDSPDCIGTTTNAWPIRLMDYD